MAQVLDFYEELFENYVPAGESEEFKAMVRRKMNAVAVDACDIMGLDGEEVNGYAIDLQDRLHADGRPKPSQQPVVAASPRGS
jgi:hypothetical protein